MARVKQVARQYDSDFIPPPMPLAGCARARQIYPLGQRPHPSVANKAPRLNDLLEIPTFNTRAVMPGPVIIDLTEEPSSEERIFIDLTKDDDTSATSVTLGSDDTYSTTTVDTYSSVDFTYETDIDEDSTLEVLEDMLHKRIK